MNRTLAETEMKKIRREVNRYYGFPTAQPAPDASPEPKPLRNAPCWCGSGKKLKRCHQGYA